MCPTLRLAGLALAFAVTLQPLPFSTVANGQQSAIEQRRDIVVRTAAEWKALWREHAPNEPLPAVDFTTHMVVGVFAGMRSTGGHAVTITDVRRESATIVVTWRGAKPPADAMVSQVLTFPFHLARVDLSKDPVEFREGSSPK
jgi:hypothetical protein